MLANIPFPSTESIPCKELPRIIKNLEILQKDDCCSLSVILDDGITDSPRLV